MILGVQAVLVPVVLPTIHQTKIEENNQPRKFIVGFPHVVFFFFFSNHTREKLTVNLLAGLLSSFLQRRNRDNSTRPLKEEGGETSICSMLK